MVSRYASSRRASSRRALGEIIGVGLKQVNKYETGVNRVSAGRLYEISVALGMPVAWFFEGISGDAPAGESADLEAAGTADQHEVSSLLFYFHQVPGDVRSKFLRLVRSNIVHIIPKLHAICTGYEHFGMTLRHIA